MGGWTSQTERFKIYPTCSNCKSTYKSQCEFLYHKLVCLPIKHICLQCDLSFPDKKSFNLHKIDHYSYVGFETEISIETAPENPISAMKNARTCGICQRVFCSKRAFRLHKIFKKCKFWTVQNLINIFGRINFERLKNAKTKSVLPNMRNIQLLYLTQAWHNFRQKTAIT